MATLPVTLAEIEAAAERLAGIAHRTPVITCQTIDRMVGARVAFKAEQWQRVGAFKFRGAMNAVLQLDDATRARGVVTHSSGNHAQALALAARLGGTQAHVVMPEDSARPKIAAVRGYGATVVLCAPTLAARERTAAEVAARTGAHLVPPYDHPHVIAGQGTMALELLADCPGLEAVIAPVGGGGMISGVALAISERAAGVRVFGAEPELADDAARSLAAGRLIPQTGTATIADGLRTSLGEYTWPIIRERVSGIFTVSEADIVAAMRLCWERMKVVIEPSAAVAVAALLSPACAALKLSHVGVILSGGNVDLDRLPWGAGSAA